MKSQPKKRFSNPKYPPKLQVLSDPAILEKNIPLSWRKSREMTGAVAILLAANLSSCSKVGAALGNSQAIVAPIFNHGSGRGTVGCVVVTPPVFLPEEEALSIITEELSKKGLKFTQKNVKFEQVTIPSRTAKMEYFKKNGFDTAEEKIVANPGPGAVFEVDLVDSKKKVAVEYINSRDYVENGGPSKNSTVMNYNFKEAAEYLDKQIKEKGPKMYFGTFYDPVTMPEDNAIRKVAEKFHCWDENYQGDKDECSKQYQKEVNAEVEKWKALSKEQLKLQVKDFVDWLKAQGVI